MAAPPLAAAAEEGQGALQQATSTRIFYLGPVKLEIECVEAFRGTLLGAGVDATGVMLWPGSCVLARYLLEPASLAGLSSPSGHPTHIVELGAGATGLPGLLAARLLPPEAMVTLTDQDAPSLALLRKNAARANDGGETGRVAAWALSWGDEEQATEIVKERGPAALCLGADILYPAIEVSTIRMLLQSARRLLGGPEGRVLLSLIDRDQGGSLRNLLTALRDEAFLLERAWELDYDAKDEAPRLEEEEAVDEDDEGQQPRKWRRRPVVLMRGAKLLLLVPMATGDGSLQERQAAAEARWLPGVWDAPCREGSNGGEESEEEEWAPPLSSSDEED